MNSKRSGVWQTFQKETPNTAKCTICHSVLKCAGGSTSNLANHLRAKHKIEINKNEEPNPTQPSQPTQKKANTSMLKFIQRTSMEELLAKCAAYDGFSIHAMRYSSAIAEFITKRDYKIPRSEKTIKKLIIGFSKEKKLELKDKFMRMAQSGARFSITIDEWTSCNSKRYLNATLNSQEDSYKL